MSSRTAPVAIARPESPPSDEEEYDFFADAPAAPTPAPSPSAPLVGRVASTPQKPAEKVPTPEGVAVSHRAEMDAPLTRAMLAAFHAKKTGDARVDVVCVIKAAEIALEAMGVPAQKLFAGGALHEVLAAARTGGTATAARHGTDVVRADGTPAEIKTTTVPLGAKASLMIKPPQRLRGETLGTYYDRVAAKMHALGDVHLTHRISAEKSVDYVLSADFVAFYLRTTRAHSPADADKKVNLGGIACPGCERIHRVVQLGAYERAWRAAPAAYNWLVAFERSVPGKCGPTPWLPEDPPKK